MTHPIKVTQTVNDQMSRYLSVAVECRSCASTHTACYGMEEVGRKEEKEERRKRSREKQCEKGAEGGR